MKHKMKQTTIMDELLKHNLDSQLKESEGDSARM